MKRHDWDEQAPNWIAWVRDLADDAYRDYAPRFFDLVVPEPGGATLDIGCGEGRSARDLVTRRHRVVAIDASPTLLRAARAADPAGRFAIADAAALPFADATFDLVVAYNVLMDLDDLAGSLREAARVLEPGGTLAACVVHPLAEAGEFEARDANARFFIDRSYFEERRYRNRFSRDGYTMTFSSSAYPLETYARLMGEAGFAIVRLDEPRAPAESIARDPAEARWARIPLFLFLRAVKLATATP